VRAGWLRIVLHISQALTLCQPVTFIPTGYRKYFQKSSNGGQDIKHSAKQGCIKFCQTSNYITLSNDVTLVGSKLTNSIEKRPSLDVTQKKFADFYGSTIFVVEDRRGSFFRKVGNLVHIVTSCQV